MAERVHARFFVSRHTRYTFHGSPTPQGDQFTLNGVRGEPFGSATPAASLEMTIHNPEAAQVFKEALETGRQLDVFFSLVETEQ